MQLALSVNAPSLSSALAARLAIASTAAASLLLLSLHALSPEYSPAWRMVSEYANGHYSWVLSLMFVAYGLSILALAFAIHSKVETRRGKIGLVLLALSGIGAVSAAQFDLNQEALHDLGGILGIICLPIAAVLISPQLAALSGWASSKKPLLFLANLTWASVLVWMVTFVVMLATFAYALGGNLPSTPPEELPAGVIALVGWTNRLLIASAWAWVSAVAWFTIKFA